jgi:type I restriction enzyme M protein
MAIAEKLGKDRRANPVYERDEDGAELLFEEDKEYLTYTSKGKVKVKSRMEKVKRLDDDLPKISAAFLEMFKTAKS